MNRAALGIFAVINNRVRLFIQDFTFEFTNPRNYKECFIPKKCNVFHSFRITNVICVKGYV